MPFSLRKVPRFGIAGLVVVSAIFLALMYFVAVAAQK
jgi:hypothetical protein